MATIIDTEYRTIAVYFACAIEYGDVGGLSDSDINALAKYEDNNLAAMKSIGSDNVTHEWGEEYFFGRDCITGIMAECCEVSVHFFGKDGVR